MNLNHNIIHVGNVIGLGKKKKKNFQWKKIQAFINSFNEIIQDLMMFHSEQIVTIIFHNFFPCEDVLINLNHIVTLWEGVDVNFFTKLLIRWCLVIDFVGIIKLSRYEILSIHICLKPKINLLTNRLKI